jgi:hypothetical protein
MSELGGMRNVVVFEGKEILCLLDPWRKEEETKEKQEEDLGPMTYGYFAVPEKRRTPYL